MGGEIAQANIHAASMKITSGQLPVNYRSTTASRASFVESITNFQ
jgi:hypothetical protein